ncbi:MAG: BTAD domain-containing putative transcriptional regulator [Chloroflexota bacterium]
MAHKLFLFGPPQISIGERAIPFKRRKGLALLAYLAVEQQPQSRETLEGLLWPEFSADSARNNLRRELSLLKKQLEAPLIQADTLQIGLNPEIEFWVDTNSFQTEIEALETTQQTIETDQQAKQLAEAISVYRNDFLAGFNLPNCIAFEDWHSAQRSRLQQLLMEGLSSLVNWHVAQSHYELALDFARQNVTADPLDEAAQHALIQTLALTGQKTAAIRQYDQYKALLWEELRVEPEKDLSDLFDSIRDNKIQKQQQRKPQTQLKPSETRVISHNLPLQATKLLGREQEIVEITNRLQDPNCRLVTITGQGGMGKTVLAAEVGRSLLEQASSKQSIFDKIYLIPLQAITQKRDLYRSIVAGLDIQLQVGTGENALEGQLVRYLNKRAILLILDNFEQLVSHAGLLATLITSTQRLKIVVTSRETLSLSDEWVYPLNGLPYPDNQNLSEKSLAGENILKTYSAMALFVANALRVQKDFDWRSDKKSVAEICQLVGGSPLAIKLAASWTRLLPVAKVVEQIKKNLDFLTAQSRDVPQRHQSMRAIINHSWELLSAPEQETLQKLSLLYSGFTYETAEAVADASLGHLASLIDKSFLVVENGRYYLHQYTKQFAAEKLKESGQQAEISDASASYYLQLLAAQRPAIHGPHPNIPLQTIQIEYENIIQALSQTVFRKNIIPDWQVIDVLIDYHEHAGPFARYTNFKKAIDHFDESSTPEPNPSRLLNIMSGYLINALTHSSAQDEEKILRRMATLATRINNSLADAIYNYTAGISHRYQRHYAQATAVFDEALTKVNLYLQETPTSTQAHSLKIKILQDMGDVLGWQDQFDSAIDRLQSALALTPRDDVRTNAITHSFLGTIYYHMESFDLASDSWGLAAEQFEKIGEKSRTGRTLGNWSAALLYQNKLEEALTSCLRAIDFLEAGADFRSLAITRDALGEIYLSMGQTADAKACFHYALDWASQEQIQNEQLLFMANLADCERQDGAVEQGLRWINRAKTIQIADAPAQYLVRFLRVEGDLLLAKNQIPEALSCYEEALSLLSENKRYDRVPLLLGMAHCFVQLSKLEQAHALLQDGIALGQATGRTAFVVQGEKLLEQIK